MKISEDNLTANPKPPSAAGCTATQPPATPAPAVVRFGTAEPNGLAKPVWSAPNTPIPSLNTTIAFEEARQAEEDTPDRLHCGAERWSVKTLSDADAGKVNF